MRCVAGQSFVQRRDVHLKLCTGSGRLIEEVPSSSYICFLEWQLIPIYDKGTAIAFSTRKIGTTFRLILKAVKNHGRITLVFALIFLFRSYKDDTSSSYRRGHVTDRRSQLSLLHDQQFFHFGILAITRPFFARLQRFDGHFKRLKEGGISF